MKILGCKCEDPSSVNKYKLRSRNRGTYEDPELVIWYYMMIQLNVVPVRILDPKVK